MGLLWQQSGRFYADSFIGDWPEMDPIRVCFLFYGELLPETLATAFVMGVSVGLVRSRRMFAAAWKRATLAAIIFSGLVATVSFAYASPGGPTRFFGSLLTLNPITLLSALGIFILLTIFGAVGAFPFLIVAGIGGQAGKRLLRRSPHVRMVVVPSMCALTLGLILAHGMLVRSAVNDFNRNLPAIRAEINRHLITVPAGTKWMPSITDSYRPSAKGFSCIFPQMRLTGEIARDGRLRSVCVYCVAPERRSLYSKDTVARILRMRGVHEEVLAELKQANSDWWAADKGVFSVVLANSYPKVN
jgi:hypothetical protein